MEEAQHVMQQRRPAERQLHDGRRIRVLAVCYGGGHVKALAPVVVELRRRGAEVVLFGLTLAGPSLHAQSIPHLGFRSLVGPDDEDALVFGRELAHDWHDNRGGLSREESVAYLGLSFADLAARVGEGEARRRLALQGRQAFLPLGPMRRAFDLHRPDVVLATNSPRAERAAMLVAAERHLPRVIINDLFGMRLAYPLEAERICVLTEGVRDTLIEQGIDASTVTATGNPLCDAIVREVANDPEVPVSLGHPRPVLLADQPAEWTDDGLHVFDDRESKEMILRFREICRSADALALVRRHPTRHRGWLAETEGVQWVDDLPLYPLLRACDLIVTRSSTVGLEAALLGRPVVTFHPHEGPSPLPLAEGGVALGAQTLEELSAAVHSALHDASLRAELGRTRARRLLSDFGCDGHAAERVADLVEELVGSPRESRPR